MIVPASRLNAASLHYNCVRSASPSVEAVLAKLQRSPPSNASSAGSQTARIVRVPHQCGFVCDRKLRRRVEQTTRIPGFACRGEADPLFRYSPHRQRSYAPEWTSCGMCIRRRPCRNGSSGSSSPVAEGPPQSRPDQRSEVRTGEPEAKIGKGEKDCSGEDEE